MATVEVEVYTPLPPSGTALDPQRPETPEDEIAEHEWIVKRDLAVENGLTALATACEQALARLRVARTIPFPLMTPEEFRVWRAFLPMTYSTVTAKDLPAWGGMRHWTAYAFDAPPVSVLETLRDVRREGYFDELQIWTPERPMPEPILVGIKAFAKQAVGPFLIARWGEALEPFETIKGQVSMALEVGYTQVNPPGGGRPPGASRTTLLTRPSRRGLGHSALDLPTVSPHNLAQARVSPPKG